MTAAELPQERALRIETPRLDIRAMTAHDETLYCDLFTDADIMRFIGPAWSRDRALQNFRAALRSMRRQPPDLVVLTITDRASRQALGICSLQQFDALRRRVDTGIMLKRDSRGLGLATEAVAAVVEWAFALFPVDEVRACIACAHAAAERVVIGVGFSLTEESGPVHEGVHRIWTIRRKSSPASISVRHCGGE